jgi:CheY-like chemotaxis protein
MASRFRVLIVEDEPLVADVLQATLDSEYHVSSVNTVKEALAFLHTSHADVHWTLSCPTAEAMRWPLSLKSSASR